RFAFNDGGLHITPRSTPAEPDYTLKLSLSSYGYDGAVSSAPAPKLHADGNRIEYARGDLLEWYLNDPRGLEQGFTLTTPPVIEATPPSDTLRFDFSVSGSLTPRI